MYMVTKPQIYDVIVTTNMFGDIITDLGAAIQGGMGMAASGNINPTRKQRACSSPCTAARPTSPARTGRTRSRRSCRSRMMLDFLGQAQAAQAIRKACEATVANPKNHTRDLGGTATTTQVGDAVCYHITE
jgi:isocitrate/isopropylmalate dehydrogenase